MSGPGFGRIAIVGAGRLGQALASALELDAPFGRGFDGLGFDIVILAVPDGQIASASACIGAGPMIGHCAGSLGLDALGRRECFAMHPLMTVPASPASPAGSVFAGAVFAGAGAAVAGNTPHALAIALELARTLGMQPFEIHDEDRAAYHAAASIASNFLVTLADAAETLLASTGVDRAILVPLVRAAVESWAGLGGPTALTGPIARGDEATVQRQRAAVTERTPQLLDLFDTMTAATRAMAARRSR